MEKQLQPISQPNAQGPEYLHNLRHSAAHLIAQAVLELFPRTLLTIGPVTENGFFYDFFTSKEF